MMESDSADSQNSRTVTRAGLANAVYRRVGLPRREAAELVEIVLEEICQCLAEGESVKLTAFGSFLLRDKRQRIGRNPLTGVEAPISPRRVVRFKPSNILRARINGLTPGGQN